jgi:hypothetical protein
MKMTRRKVLIGSAAAAASAVLPLPAAHRIEWLDLDKLMPQISPYPVVPKRIYRVRGGNRVHVTRTPEYLGKIASRLAEEKRAREAIVRALRHRSLAPLPDAV